MASSQTSVLVVDDDQVILDTVADFLRLDGYDVRVATNGSEAYSQIVEYPPALILSDISMPEVDGYQLYERIRHHPEWGTIPFIFMSARGQQSDVRLGYAMGADAYLIKPFELEDLQVAVQSRLQRMQDIQAAARSDVEGMKQQLMTVFGHEIRTPLTYIYGYLSMIRDERRQMSDDDLENMLAGMERGTKRLMRLVEDLMLLMRLESGAAEHEIKRLREQVPLSAIIAEVVAKHASRAASQNLTIDVQETDEMQVYGLPQYLQEIVERLLDNAIKFSRLEGGTIWIRAEQQGERSVIAITDEGIGIDPAKQGQLFGRFQQIDRAKMEQQGLGLGLAIAGGLANLHGGSITVQSAPNQGSTFTVTLPVG